MNRFVLITGADRGVGLELVKAFLKEGDTVFAGQYLSAWNLLNSLKKEYSNKLHIIDLDISSDESTVACEKYISTITDKLDILINNGAILGDIGATILSDINFDEIQKVFNVTALGALRMSNKHIQSILKSHKKLIVNISSEAGSINNCERKSWFAYCMSKAALNMQSVMVHNEIKEQGGQVMVIHPGWVKSYMQGKLDEEGELTPEQSAASILKLIENSNEYKGEKPVYLDYSGKKMEW